VIYLVEGDVLSFFCNNHSKGVTKEAFETALAKTQLHDNFFLKQTKTTQDTIQYLHALTLILQMQYTTQCTQYCTTLNEELLRRKQKFSLCIRDSANRELLLTFDQYNELNAKNNLTLTDIFAKQIIVVHTALCSCFFITLRLVF
jgi:ERCC4-type nuclease